MLWVLAALVQHFLALLISALMSVAQQRLLVSACLPGTPALHCVSIVTWLCCQLDSVLHPPHMHMHMVLVQEESCLRRLNGSCFHD